MTERTLVQELREHSANAELNRNMLTAALTARAADKIEELLEGFEGCCCACEPVGLLNKRLLKERDEARRMYCKAVADHYEYACNAELDGAGPYTQKDVAKDEGWDCFKEDGKPCQ